MGARFEERELRLRLVGSYDPGDWNVKQNEVLV
jgi:hypothetical protein